MFLFRLAQVISSPLTLLSSQIGFVAGEMKHPARDLPRVISTAMIVVIFGFVFANIAFYSVLPMESVRRSPTVAIVIAHVYTC